MIALDEALDRLTAIDPRKGKVVELRFFGGLSVEGTAEALHVPAGRRLGETEHQGARRGQAALRSRGRDDPHPRAPFLRAGAFFALGLVRWQAPLRPTPHVRRAAQTPRHDAEGVLQRPSGSVLSLSQN